MVTLYLRSSLNSSHMSRIWLVVLVLDHGLLYPPCDTRLIYKECKLHCSAECSLTIISSDKLSLESHGTVYMTFRPLGLHQVCAKTEWSKRRVYRAVDSCLANIMKF